MSSAQPGVYWRVKWAGVGAVLALGLVALAWFLTSVVKSPQDALASAAPPAPSQITVPVEERALVTRLRTTGHLASPTRVEGNLSVDDRDKVTRSARIVVTGSGGNAVGKLTGISPVGDFAVTLESPLKGAAESSVQVVFEPRDPAKVGLVVPISALFTSSAGETSVVVVRAGVEHELTVRTGAEAAGFVMVEAVDGDALAAGDQVLVSEPGE